MASQLKSQEAAFKSHRKPKKAKKDKSDFKIQKAKTPGRIERNAKRNERRKKARVVAQMMRAEGKHGVAAEQSTGAKVEEEKETMPDTNMEEAD